MWRVGENMIVLEGAEAQLIRLAVSRLFDTRHFAQNSKAICMLADIARALLDRDTPAPDATAGLERAMHELYMSLLAIVEDEIRQEMDFCLDPGSQPIDRRTRLAVCAALAQIEIEDGVEIDAFCVELPEWRAALQFLADGVVPDWDWELEDEFGNADPDCAATVRDIAGIDTGYFAPVPEPTVAQLQEAVRYLSQIR